MDTANNIKEIEKIARVLRGPSQQDVDLFVARYQELSGFELPSETLLGLSLENRPLRIGQLQFQPVTGEDSFIKKVFETGFCSQLPGGHSRSQPEYQAATLQRKLIENKIDVLSHLITVDRHLRFNFFARFPFRFSLGAVVHKRHAPYIEDLRSILKGSEKSSSGVTIRPITILNEVGFLHCIRLGFAGDRLSQMQADAVLELRPDAVAATLLELDSKQQEQESALGHAIQRVIPIVLVDELSHFKVLASLNQQGCVGIPVIPPTTEYSARYCECRREMPIFQLGLAVHHKSDISNFLADALRTYIEGEVETVSNALADTAERFYQIVMEGIGAIPLELPGQDGAPVDLLDDPKSRDRFYSRDRNIGNDEVERQSIARRWVRYAMRISSEDLVSDAVEPHWRTTLARGRQKVSETLVDDHWRAVAAFIEQVGKRFEWFRLRRIVEETEREFDVLLSEEKESTESDPLSLSYRVESKILGFPSRRLKQALRFRTVVGMLPPGLERASVWQALRELAEQQGDDEESRRQLHIVENRLRGTVNSSLITLLATVGEPNGEVTTETLGEDRQLAGILIGHSDDGDHGVEHLDVLFVRKVWRGYGITADLINEWVGRAARAGRKLMVSSGTFHRRQFTLLQQLGFAPSEPFVETLSPPTLVFLPRSIRSAAGNR